MAITAQLFDGTVLEFPDDTTDAVINSTAARVTKEIQNKADQNKSFLEDVATKGKAGILSLPGAVTGLLDIPVAAVTGKPMVSQGWEGIGQLTGFQPSKWAEEANQKLSPQYVAQQQAISNVSNDPNASGMDLVRAYLANPSAGLAGPMAESIPSMLAGGAGAARMLGGKLAGLTPALRAGIVAGAGEGAVTAGQIRDSSFEQGVGTPEEERMKSLGAAGAGTITGLISGLGGAMTSKLGILDPDSLFMKAQAKAGLTQAELDAFKREANRSMAQRVGLGMVQEGLIEEMPQSAQERMWQNWIDNRPLTEGVKADAIQGALLGAGMGGTFNIPNHARKQYEEALAAQNIPAPVETPAEVAPIDTGAVGPVLTGADIEDQPIDTTIVPPITTETAPTVSPVAPEVVSETPIVPTPVAPVIAPVEPALVEPVPETPITSAPIAPVTLPALTKEEQELKDLPIGGVIDVKGNKFIKTQVGFDIVKPTETAPVVTKPVEPDKAKLENKVSSFYKDLLDKHPDANKIWKEQAQEQIDNPNRYHNVQEEENPKGIKIGDTVSIGEGDKAQNHTVLSVRKNEALVNSGEVNKYSIWQPLGYLNPPVTPTAGARRIPTATPVDKPDDGMVKSGEQLRTVNGRIITVPPLKLGGDRQITNTIKRLNEWSHAEAIKETAGNNYQQTLLKAIDPKKMSQADQDTVTSLLFGDTQVGAKNRITTPPPVSTTPVSSTPVEATAPTPVEAVAEALVEKPKTQAQKNQERQKAQKAKSKSNTLLTKLIDLGGVSTKDKRDVTGEKQSFPPGYARAFRTNAKTSLRGHIERGSLDEFLPHNMRLGANTMDQGAFDSEPAYDYLSNLIKNGKSVTPYIEAEKQATEFERYAGTETMLSDSEGDVLDDLVKWATEGGIDIESIKKSLVGDTQAQKERNLLRMLQEARDEEQSNAEPIETTERPAGLGTKISSQETTGELKLTGQTEEEIKAGEAKVKAAEETKAKEEAKAEQKRKSETEPYNLTGSDREADVAGAKDLFAPKTEAKTIIEPVVKQYAKDALDGFLVGDSVRFGNTPGVVVGLEGDYVKFRPDSAKSPKAYQRVQKSQLTLVSRPDNVSKSSASKEESKFGTEAGQLNADMAGLIQLLGANMYASNLVDVSVKELLQNSFDAVKGAIKVGLIKEGDITIDINRDTRTIKFTDNARGMTTDIVKNAFFTVAGSDKSDLDPSERSGGLGLAKMGFMLGAKRLQLDTVRDGVRTKVDTTAKNIANSDFKIVKTPAPETKHGTIVEVTIPENYTDPKTGQEQPIWFFGKNSIEPLKQPLIGPVKVTLNYTYGGTETTVLDIGVNFNSKETPFVTNVNFDWGSADIYFGVSRKDHPKHKILSAGVYQFDDRFMLNKSEIIPYDIIVNVKPKVEAKHPDYPFENSRERFKGRLEKDVKALSAFLARRAMGEEAKDLQENFKGIISMPRVEAGEDIAEVSKKLRKVFDQRGIDEKAFQLPEMPKSITIRDSIVLDDIGKVIIDLEKEAEKLKDSSFQVDKDTKPMSDFMLEMTQDPKLPIFHNNTNVNYIDIGKQYGDPQKFFAELGTLMVEMKEELGKSNLWGYDVLNPENLFFSGISVDKKYGGVHIKVPYKATLLNPFYDWGAKTLFGIRQNFLNTMIHEIAHTGDMEHGVGHNGQMIKVEQYLADNGLLDYYRDAILDVLMRHESAFTAMREAYGKSTTQNTAKSLEDYAKGAASARGTEDGGNNKAGAVQTGGGQGGNGNIQANTRPNKQNKLGKQAGNLPNVDDEQRLMDDLNVPNVPSHIHKTLREKIGEVHKSTEQLVNEVRSGPNNVLKSAGSAIGDSLTQGRIEAVFYGIGLERADAKKYAGKLRDVYNNMLPSIALKNAIHWNSVYNAVLHQGKMRYDNKLGAFTAYDSDDSMKHVIEQQHTLRQKLGVDLADKVINTWFAAKRTKGIQTTYLNLMGEIRDLQEELLTEDDPEVVAQLTADLNAAQNWLDALESAFINVPSFLVQINQDKPTKVVDGKTVSNILYDMDGMPVLNDEAMDEIIALSDKHTELNEMMKNWTAVNHNMLDNMAFSGRISEKEAEGLKGIEGYSPWQRIRDEEEESLFGNKGSTTTSGIARFRKTRTELPLENVVENMTNQVKRNVSTSLRNFAYNRIAMEYAARREPAIDEKTGLTKVDKKTGLPVQGKLKLFSKEGRDSEGVRFPIYANGKRVIIQIEDSQIADALLGLAMGPVNIPFQAALSGFSNLLRRSITFSGYFQTKQIFYDAPTAAWVSGVKNPFKVWANSFSTYANALVSIGTGVDAPTIKILKAAGVGGYHTFHRESLAEEETTIEAISGKGFAKFKRLIDKIGDASDYAQRGAIYDQVLAETGDASLALLKASDIVDWNKHGLNSAAQAIRQTVPFLGAYAIQLDAFGQAATASGTIGNARKEALTQFYLKTGLGLAVVVLAYAIAAGSDDDYWELDDDTRARNFYVPGSKKALGYPLLIPMHSTAALFFKVMPESVWAYVVSQGTKNEIDATRARAAFWKATKDSLLGPTPIPAAIKTPLEIGLNHSFFTGSTVVPQALAGLDAAEQYNYNTSELGKAISVMTSIPFTGNKDEAGNRQGGKRMLNPIEADHLVRGWLGSVGAITEFVSNELFGENRPASQLRDNPLTGGLLGNETSRRNEALFYDLKARTEPAHNTYIKLLTEQKTEEAASYLQANERLIGLNSQVYKLDYFLQKVNAEIKILGKSVDTKLTKEGRRDEILKLQEMKQQALGDIIELRKLAGL